MIQFADAPWNQSNRATNRISRDVVRQNKEHYDTRTNALRAHSTILVNRQSKVLGSKRFISIASARRLSKLRTLRGSVADVVRARLHMAKSRTKKTAKVGISLSVHYMHWMEGVCMAYVLNITCPSWMSRTAAFLL